MNKAQLASALSGLSELRVGVLGDFALDLYFDLQTDTGEVSIETGKPVYYCSAVRGAPGAAGTIINNLLALGVEDVHAFGAIGDDLFGRELKYLLAKNGVDASGLILVEDNWDTCVYMKPLEQSVEASRFDFGTANVFSTKVLDQVLADLAGRISQLDVLIINQQFEKGLMEEQSIERLEKLIAEYPVCLVLSDLRMRAGQLGLGIVKGNVDEIARMLNIRSFDQQNTQLCQHHLIQAQKLLNRPVLMTRGKSGMMYADKNGLYSVPGIMLSGEIDEVGAGDACLSAFAACLASGVPVLHALHIANLAAAVTVQKLNQTGTASPEEILELAVLSLFE